jgi:hypothetical protein
MIYNIQWTVIIKFYYQLNKEVNEYFAMCKKSIIIDK